MTPALWFAVAQSVVMMIVAVLVYYWGRDRKLTEDAIAARFVTHKETMAREFEARALTWDAKLALRDQRLDELESQIDQAREHTSKQAGRVQAKVEDLRSGIEACRVRISVLESDQLRRDRAAGIGN